MVQSMTGFGAASATVGSERIDVEIRSVNHRFCEVKARLPRELASLEPALLRQVRGKIARGAVDVTVSRNRAAGAGSVPRVDVALAREYAAAARQVADALGLTEAPSLAFVLAADGVLSLEERPADLRAAGEAVAGAIDEALGKILAMRAEEGRALGEDIGRRIDRVEALAAEVARQAPALLAELRARLERRLAELMPEGPPAGDRVAQEIALYLERTDVAEELTRLGSHLAQFRALLGKGEAVGRRMDFLVQEVHREINTVGSKSQSAAIAATVVELKAEAERIREQVQNVE